MTLKQKQVSTVFYFRINKNINSNNNKKKTNFLYICLQAVRKKVKEILKNINQTTTKKL